MKTTEMFQELETRFEKVNAYATRMEGLVKFLDAQLKRQENGMLDTNIEFYDRCTALEDECKKYKESFEREKEISKTLRYKVNILTNILNRRH